MQREQWGRSFTPIHYPVGLGAIALLVMLVCSNIGVLDVMNCFKDNQNV